MIVYNRSRAPMGYLGQEVEPTIDSVLREVLAYPPGISSYVMLVFIGMAKANEALYLARDGKIEAAIALQRGTNTGDALPGTATWISVKADSMLRELYYGRSISEKTFDRYFKEFQIPMTSMIGDTSVAIIAGQSGINRYIENVRAFFAGFESTADRFFADAAARFGVFYNSIIARNLATQQLLGTMKAYSSMLPETTRAIPGVERSLKEGQAVQAGIEAQFAKSGVTTTMLKAGTLGAVPVRVIVAPAWQSLSKWLKPVLKKLGLKMIKPDMAARVLHFLGTSLKQIVTFGIATYAAAWIFGIGGKHHQEYEEAAAAAERDRKEAEAKKNEPKKKAADDVIKDSKVASESAKRTADSARAAFPDEAGLFEGDSDNTWILYALGGGSLALGLYLYYSNKKN